MTRVKSKISEEDVYPYEGYDVFTAPKESRIDLNNLLKRNELQKKQEKKTNLIIIAGVTSVVFVFCLFIFL